MSHLSYLLVIDVVPAIYLIYLIRSIYLIYLVRPIYLICPLQSVANSDGISGIESDTKPMTERTNRYHSDRKYKDHLFFIFMSERSFYFHPDWYLFDREHKPVRILIWTSNVAYIPGHRRI